MSGKKVPWTVILRCLLLVFLLASYTNVALAQAYSPMLSANIPLNSYIYTYLDKLEGIGGLANLSTGTKPYTRMQVAEWVTLVREQPLTEIILPEYAQAMLEQLTQEFGPEIAVLGGMKAKSSKLELREYKMAAASYRGQTLSQARTKSNYQPLNVNNNGYPIAEGLNGIVRAEVEASIGDYLLLNMTPHLEVNEEEEATLSLESTYFKTHYKNLEIQLGKDARWWGPGERGNLPLTNNPTPFTAIQLRNLDPIRPKGVLKFMKQMDLTTFYADMEENRSDVKSPGFFGFRAAVTPGSNFTVAGSLSAMVGGKGHELHGDDLWNFITGENALTAASDKWNSIAGFDFRWRIPQLRGLQLYGELYGEDQAGTIPFPSKNSYLAGAYLPRMSRDGRWELKLETAKTIDCTYVHSLYTDGYTFKGNLIGDAMGNNAQCYYLKLAHYLSDGAGIALHAEHLATEQSVAAPQGVDSFWVTYHMRLKSDLTLDVTLGLAEVSNFNRQAGNSQCNYLGSITCTKRF